MRKLLTLIIFVGLFLSCQSKYSKAIEYFNTNELAYAFMTASEINPGHKDYEEAQKLLLKIKAMEEERSIISNKLISDQSNKELFNQLEIAEEKLNYFFLDNYQDNTKTIGIIIRDFNEIQDKIDAAKSTNIDSLHRRAEKTEKKLKKTRASNWPQLRKKFGNILADEMWKYDMTINVKGARNTIIELISSDYSMNSNILQTQTDFNDLFKELRFKKVIFKPSKYDSEHKFYNLNTKMDFE